ncbi:MAG: GntR family transcriptional regulator [Lentisphaeria bacterium]|nr:GntR family transcriptional regulator [Lentisphaeria bacterium]
MDLNAEYFQSTFRLRPESSMPIHRQLAEYLAQQIRAGMLKPGDRMLAENEMARLLGVCRTTVRAALDHLVADGRLLRQRGRGSFIAEPRLRRTVSCLYNFTESMRESGVEPSSEVLRCEVISADERTSEKLQLRENNRKIFLLKRLRLADGQPLLLETSRIPYYLCPGIETNHFSGLSLYTVLRSRYGLKIESAEEMIAAILMDRESGRLLNCRIPAPGYQIERVAKLASGTACEYTSSVTRADKCVFRLDLRAASGHGALRFERTFPETQGV